MENHAWEVVGGSDKGGILVRVGTDVSSESEADRLATGSLLQGQELHGDRLRYKLLAGTGPASGWVSIRLKDKDLVVRSDRRVPSEDTKAESPIANPEPRQLAEKQASLENSWRIRFNGADGRDEQVRLLFAFVGVGFEVIHDDVSLSPVVSKEAIFISHGCFSLSTVAGVLQYVGESLGLGASDVTSRSRALMHVVGVEAMRKEVFDSAVEAMQTKSKRLTTFTNIPYKKWLGHFERYLRVSRTLEKKQGIDSGPFILGSRLCYADLVLYDCLTAIWDLGCYGRDEAERAKLFPRLCALVQAVTVQPSLVNYGRPHSMNLSSRFGELPAFTPPTGNTSQLWEVTVVNEQGGVLVRQGKETTSAAESSRLATGALVKELELVGDRLRYQCLEGFGPATGWVSIRLGTGKALLTKTQRVPMPDAESTPSSPAEGTWRVLYNDVPGRGQQLRLLFIMTGTPFEDKRIAETEPFTSRKCGDASPLAFDFVPIVQHGSRTISTTAAAMQYIGESIGLGAPGGTEAASSQAVAIASWSESMRNDVFYPAFFEMGKKKRRLALFDMEPYHRWLSHFERYFEAAGTGPFVFGSQLCYADVAFFDCVSSIWDLCCYGRDEQERTERYPRVCALVEAVGRQPNLKTYGHPHAENIKASLGELPPPRSPQHALPASPPTLSRRKCLNERLAAARDALAKAGEPSLAVDKKAKVIVVIGTSHLIAMRPKLAEELAALINQANEESLRGMPERKEGWHKNLTAEDIRIRCSYGDTGTHCNRVLHIALKSDKPVGCISSTYETPWTEDGVGHWGMLAVDTKTQGEGVASALVAAATLRLSMLSTEVHIEYHHARGHQYSDRLKGWYEGKLGFQCVAAQMSGKDTVLRVCRRKFSFEELSLGQQLRCKEVVDDLATRVGPDVGSETSAPPLCCSTYTRLASFLQTKGAEVAPSVGVAYQFDIYDVGPAGRFFVDLRPSLCFADYGDEPSADCRIIATDSDLEEWVHGRLEWMHGYWSGRLRVAGAASHADAEKYVRKLSEICKASLKE